MVRKFTLVFLLISIFVAAGAPVFSQNNPSPNEKPEISFSGVVDVFYAYDFNKPNTPYRQPFLYNHNRHQEVNLNIGLLRASIQHSKYRAQIGIQAGTYPEDNYAAERDLLKHVFEAYAGLSLHEKVWVDAGIFGSHIGFESAITSDNWTLTRSLLAENSPYFLSGARLTYTPNSHWEMAVLVTNGWQRIQRVAGNSFPGFGTQLTYSPTDNFLLNWSTFLGTEKPDISRKLRYFNNLYGQFKLSERIGIIAGFDIGAQQKVQNRADYDIWFSPVLISRWALNSKWATALRAEYYSDRNSVIIPSLNNQAFKTSGFSANLDYSPAQNVMWRIEGRWFHSQNTIFRRDTSFRQNNSFITSSITVLIQD